MKSARLLASLIWPMLGTGCSTGAFVADEPMSVRELVERREELLGKRVRVVGYLQDLTYLTWSVSGGFPDPNGTDDIYCGGHDGDHQYIDLNEGEPRPKLLIHTISVRRDNGTFGITMYPQAVITGTLEYDESFGGRTDLAKSARLKNPVFEDIGAGFCRVGADD